MPADRANIFLTLEEVMKEKCLDHVATLVGLDEKTIEEDFKAVDTDEDGKVTLEEGMKVYELRLRIPSEGFWEFRLLCLWLLFKISNVG